MSKTILVVEDDKTVQKLLVEILEGEGFSVITERDGEWALRTFETKDIDFIILDILIPVMNGFQVAEKIRKTVKGKDVPLLMISGIYRGVNHRLDAIRKYQAIEYLDKPLSMEKMLDVLRSAFGADYPSHVAAEAERAALDRKAPEPYASPETTRELEEVEQRSREFSGATRRGTLAETSFPELLAQLYRDRADGALLLKRDRLKKIVYLKKGYPVFIKSNLLNECLGKVMVREKMISEEECEESIVRMKDAGRQQGTVLVEMGCISPHNLHYALQRQLQIKLYDLFGWEDGEFQYNPKSSMPPATVSLDNTTATLIYEGIKRKIRLERLRRLLDVHLLCYVAPNPDPLFRFQDMDLEADEEKFVARLNGRMTLKEILDLGLNKERAYQIVYALKCAQMIALSEAPTGASDAEYLAAVDDEVSCTDERMRTSEVDQAEGFLPPPLVDLPDGAEEYVPETGEVDAFDVGPMPPPMLPRVNTEERVIREQLAQKSLEIKRQDFFEVLGIPRDAPTAEVKKAYFSLAKKYHPDRLYAAASSEVRRIADEIFQGISLAHDTLADDERRASYLEELGRGKKKDSSSEVSKILTAEGIFQKGEESLRQKEFVTARDYFQQTVNLCPEEGEFHAYLGWALFQSAPEDEETVRRARDHINQAISLNPKLDKAYLFLGYIYKAMNYREIAEHEFEKAIQCNPDCTEALRELRLINMRRKGGKKEGGGLFKRDP